MTKLEELIEKLCPDGVEYKTVGEIANISRGKVMSKDYLKNNIGEYPVYSSQTENNGQLGAITTYMYDGDYLTWTTDGANAGTVFFRSGKFSITNVCGLIDVKDNDLMPKFLYYFLNKEAPNHVNSGMGNPKLMSNVMSNIKLPVPPLEVQREIVRILDNFTFLTTELAAELAARQKQYEYYRDSLLTFENADSSIHWMKLGDIGDVTKLAGFEFTNYVQYSNNGSIIALRGLNVKNGSLILNDVKYIDHSDFSKLNRSKLFADDMLFTYVGTVGQVALVDMNDKYYLAPNVARIRFNDCNVKAKFVLYYFQSNQFVNGQMNRLMAESSMKNLTMEKIRKFIIPIPSLEVQQRIVDILDRFDTLCNDITSGLPAEIEARQKQYEYYRDKLLTFKELKKEA